MLKQMIMWQKVDTPYLTLYVLLFKLSLSYKLAAIQSCTYYLAYLNVGNPHHVA
jgi:hypothetical protein